MPYIPLVLSLLLCLTFPLPSSANEQQNNLSIHTLTPPIPPSYYGSWYKEDNTGQSTHTVTVNEQERSYQTYAPPQTSDTPRPAILLLHGAKRGGASLVEQWKSTADKHNIILIGPKSLNDGWQLTHDGTPFLKAVIDDAKTRYNIDSKRLYMFGHSSGANFSLYISIAHSLDFAANALHAGKLYQPEHKALIPQAKRKIPIGFFIGTNDALFPLDQVKNSAKAFADQQHDTSLYILDGHNHWYYDIAPFINEKVWEFLSKHQLN